MGPTHRSRDVRWGAVNRRLGQVLASHPPDRDALPGQRRCSAKRAQYSPLMTKKEARIVPANLDFCLANLKRVATSSGTSTPSDSLKPTARFPASAIVYITLIDKPDS